MFPRCHRKKTAPRRPSFDVLEDRLVLSPSVIATIPFGSSRAGAITANPATQRVYAAQEDFRRLAVIDGTTNTITATAPTLGFHTGSDANPATNRVYVSQQFAGSVRILDGATNTVLQDLPVPGLLHTIGDLAVNPAASRLYVIRANNNDVAVFDTTTLTFLTSIAFGPPGGPGLPSDALGIAVDPGTNRVYIANPLSDRVTVIDGASNTILTTVPVGDHPYQIGINPVSHRVYVSNHLANTVSVMDGTPGSPTENTVVVPAIPVGTRPLGIGINPLTGRAYVANNESDDVSVIDERTGTVLATVAVGDQPQGVVVLPATSRVYVANDGGHSVSVIEDVGECVPAPPGLVAWWSAEGDASDRTGQHTGTLMNGVTFAPGLVGQAFQLDGVDDLIRVPHSAALHPAGGLTIEAWINSASTAGPRVIASKWNDQTRDWSYIFKDHNSNDKLRIELSRSVHNDLADLSGATSIVPGRWVHAAATFDGSTVRLYFNGVEDARLDVGPGQQIDASSTDFLIGAGFGGGGVAEPFAGLIDELAVYDRALTAAEIEAIVHAGGAGKCLNRPPVADAGGPYTVAEGGSLALDAGASTDPDGDALSYTWDVNDDGTFGDAAGVRPTLTWTELQALGIDDGPAVFRVRVRVDDGHGHVVVSSPALLAVENAAPVGSVHGPASGVRGQRRTFVVAAADASLRDQQAGFRFAIDWGDGSREEVNGPSGLALDHVYTESGSYRVQVTAADRDGSVSAPAAQQVAIHVAELQEDTLAVGGSTGHDCIVIAPADRAGGLAVWVNGVGQGTFSSAGRIVVYGQAGDDFIWLSDGWIRGRHVGITAPAILYGDDGNDLLLAEGSTAGSVLLGGSGNDFLLGGSGADVLIGGVGSDLLLGLQGGDLLIGGTTAFDGDLAALEAVRAEWSRPDADYLTRVRHLDGSLAGGLNGPYVLTAATVHDDEADWLFGGAGLDWFFASAGDHILGRRPGEVVSRV